MTVPSHLQQEVTQMGRGDKSTGNVDSLRNKDLGREVTLTQAPRGAAEVHATVGTELLGAC